MRYMLDTNIVSELIRNPGGAAAQRARPLADTICLSIIVAAELRYGCAKKGSLQLLGRVEQFLSAIPVLPFEQPADNAYGTIRTLLEMAGAPIGSNDLLIAAHAVTVDATLVTANAGELRRVQGLRVENWLV